MESIVSVAIIIDSIVSVHRNYEKRKRKRTGGKWQVFSCFGLSPHPQQATSQQRQKVPSVLEICG
jgi:hypothetical protein